MRNNNFILILILFYLIFINKTTFSQDSIVENTESNRIIKVKMNVTSLIDFTPSLQLSYEYNVYKRWHIQHEAGYITHLLSPYWTSDSKMQGYRIKNQLKYYLPLDINGEDVFYFAGEVMLKKINYYEERYFGMYDNSYFQSIRYKKIKDVLAFSFLLGFEPVLSNTNIVLDFYGGLGFRHLTITEELPLDVNDIRWDFFRRREGIHNLPGLYFGFRVGYKFGAFF